MKSARRQARIVKEALALLATPGQIELGDLRDLFELAPVPQRAEAHYEPWLSAMNNAIQRAVVVKNVPHAVAWAARARPYARFNHNLPHNLACAFCAGRQLDAAFEMCVVAVEIGYTALWQLPGDPDLAPLSAQPRFRALFENLRDGRKHPTPAPAWGYESDRSRRRIPRRDVPALLDEFGYWLQYQPHGSVGVEAFGYVPIGREHGLRDDARRAGFAFFGLGEGSDVCLFHVGRERPVVLLGGEGGASFLGGTLENFLLAWAEQATGVAELDESFGSSSRHPDLRGWLEFQGVRRAATPAGLEDRTLALVAPRR